MQIIYLGDSMTDKELKNRAMRVIFSCDQLCQLNMAKRYCHFVAERLHTTWQDIHDMQCFYDKMVREKEQLILEAMSNGDH